MLGMDADGLAIAINLLLERLQGLEAAQRLVCGLPLAQPLIGLRQVQIGHRLLGNQLPRLGKGVNGRLAVPEVVVG